MVQRNRSQLQLLRQQGRRRLHGQHPYPNPRPRDPASTSISNRDVSPTALAHALRQIVTGTLGVAKVKRVSLAMCFGGGNRTGRDNRGGAVVSVWDSFSKKFYDAAKDFVDEVSARTEEVQIHRQELNGVVQGTGVKKTVGVDKAHHKMHNKIVFSQGTSGTQAHYCGRA